MLSVAVWLISLLGVHCTDSHGTGRGLARGLGEAVTPMPKKEECPECVFGRWSCGGSCSPSPAKFSTDFRPGLSKGCFEEAITDTHTVSFDADLWCKYGGYPAGPPGTGVVVCDNMTDIDVLRFPFDMLGGCTPQSFAAEDLFSENCSWTCKRHVFPHVRCIWGFDAKGWFQSVDGTFEMCWLRQDCILGAKVTDVACRPAPFGKQGDSTQLDRARVRLAAARAKHVSNVDSENTERSSNESSDTFKKAERRRQESELDLATLVERMNLMLAPLSQNVSTVNFSAEELLATDAHRRLVGEQLKEFLEELSRVIDGTQVSSTAHIAASQELEALYALYLEIQGSLETSEKVQNLLEADKKELEDKQGKEEEEDDNMLGTIGIVIAIGVIVVIACGAAVYLCHTLSQKPPAITHNMEGQVASDGGVMVVGRPVNVDSAERPPGSGVPPGGGKGGGNDKLRGAGNPSDVDPGAPPPRAPKNAW